MATLQIKWQASDQLLLAEIAATGKGRGPDRSITVDLSQIEPTQRQALLALTIVHRGTRDEEPILNSIDITARPKPGSAESAARGMHDKIQIYLDAEPTLDEAISLAQQIAAERRTLQAEVEAIRAAERSAKQAADAALARADAEIMVLALARDLPGLRAYRLPAEIGEPWSATARAADDRRRQAITDIEDEERAADRERWIAALGSAHLQRCIAAGYNCQRQYVIERAALEAPGYVVDFDDRAAWKDRACPTPAALDAEDEARDLGLGEPIIVWLTKPASDQLPDPEGYDYEAFEPGEAVVLRGYLGKYDLVRLVCTTYA